MLVRVAYGKEGSTEELGGRVAVGGRAKHLYHDTIGPHLDEGIACRIDKRVGREARLGELPSIDAFPDSWGGRTEASDLRRGPLVQLRASATALPPTAFPPVGLCRLTRRTSSSAASGRSPLLRFRASTRTGEEQTHTKGLSAEFGGASAAASSPKPFVAARGGAARIVTTR